jgi:hypothetical protein
MSHEPVVVFRIAAETDTVVEVVESVDVGTVVPNEASHKTRNITSDQYFGRHSPFKSS